MLKKELNSAKGMGPGMVLAATKLERTGSGRKAR